jgi:hypothetical protein
MILKDYGKVTFILTSVGLGKEPKEESEEDDESSENSELFTPERPTSWTHCIKLLWSTDKRKTLLLSNPDGYFYLLYLQRCAQFFFVCKF